MDHGHMVGWFPPPSCRKGGGADSFCWMVKEVEDRLLPSVRVH